MGRKDINKVESSETENNNESQEGTNASKITWSKELIYILYDLCIKHTLWSKGKNGAIVSHKILWPKLVEEWKKVTGLPWDKPRLKNKLDGMRPKWILWKNLKSKETGLRWNYEKGTVEASEEWWSSKIQENSKFSQFKGEGIEPDLEVRLDQVFGGCAQGAEKFTPGGEVHDLQVEDDETNASSPPPGNARVGKPPGYEEVESNLGNEEWITLWKEPNHSSPNVLEALDMNGKRKGKRAMESDTSESNKSAKTGSIKTKGGSAAFIERIDHMLQIINERNNSIKEFQVAMANMMNSMSVAQPKYSETEAIDKLCSMSDFDLNSPEFYFACTLIENPQKRTILLELPDDKRRIEYIRYLYAQHKGGMVSDIQIKLFLQLKEYMDGEDDFWDSMACSISYISMYYMSYIYKEPCMTSYLTGKKWMDELLNGEVRCFNNLRMYPNLFVELYTDLESKYGLRESYRMSIIEKVGLFVYVLAHGTPNRLTQERFQHSGETVSRVFKEVLNAMDGLSKDIIVPRHPNFKETPQQLATDSRYMPFFKDCIGAIDGTHIDVVVPEEDRLRYIGRKGKPTTNVLAVCDFDLLFTYVLVGWEGSAHDSRIFLDAISDPRLKFPKPPEGKYYIGDNGYPERNGLLTPYSKVRYHQSEFRGADPKGSKEIFNRAHSSLRSCIERSFAVLKARWKILDKIPKYSFRDQNRIICACFALHNYIRRSKVGDPAFKIMDRDPYFVPPEGLEALEDGSSNEPQCVEETSSKEMTLLRDSIASSLMEANRRAKRARHQ